MDKRASISIYELIAEIVGSQWSGLDTLELAGELLVANVRFNRAIMTGGFIRAGDVDELMAELEQEMSELPAAWMAYVEAAESTPKYEWAEDPRRPTVEAKLRSIAETLRLLLSDSPVGGRDQERNN